MIEMKSFMIWLIIPRKFHIKPDVCNMYNSLMFEYLTVHDFRCILCHFL